MQKGIHISSLTEKEELGLFESPFIERGNLDYVQGTNPQKVKDQLDLIKHYRLISIYSVGSVHYAWFYTNKKIRRKKD